MRFSESNTKCTNTILDFCIFSQQTLEIPTIPTKKAPQIFGIRKFAVQISNLIICLFVGILNFVLKSHNRAAADNCISVVQHCRLPFGDCALRLIKQDIQRIFIRLRDRGGLFGLIVSNLNRQMLGTL